MRMLGKVGVSWSLWFVVAITAASGAEPTNGTTALDEYIAKRDPTYAWKLVNTIPGDGVTTYVVELTSQTWRAKPEVDRPVWQHWLVVIKPDKVEFDTANLHIGGGRNGGPPPKGLDPQWVRLALATHAVTAELRMIPNQPLVFNQDGKPRVEDD